MTERRKLFKLAAALGLLLCICVFGFPLGSLTIFMPPVGAAVMTGYVAGVGLAAIAFGPMTLGASVALWALLTTFSA